MKKCFMFVVFFCCVGAFAQDSCTFAPKEIKKIYLKVANDYTQSGNITLNSGKKIKIDSFSSWCDCRVKGEDVIYTSLAQVPENCSLCLYQKTAKNGSIYCGCKCTGNNRTVSCRSSY